ncbi:uncharacterized protein LOC107262360 [Ricinus communis]|uniref:uncharacterized protein LOC107262360 n=1 Tax=Ricinus communis TaxID=3988 RepID=UPI00201AA865|nr:uncharacterized protein LOC107262360 [Ricinus communis]
MKEGESVSDYFARILTIVNKMKANGESKGDGEVVAKILRSMTPDFNYVVCAIEEANDTSLLSIDELQSSLLVHEQRMKKKSSLEQIQALKISFGEQFRGKGRGRGSSRGRGRGRGKGSQTSHRSTIECFKCHKLGHFQWECSAKELNYVESQEEMLQQPYVREERLFTDIDENLRDTVKLGDNSSVVVAGKGNVRLKVNDVVQIITGVFYVPQLRNNLLSVGQLQEKGLSFLFQHEKCKVYHPERGLILEIKKSTNRMFMFSAVCQPLPSTCFSAITEDLVQL